MRMPPSCTDGTPRASLFFLKKNIYFISPLRQMTSGRVGRPVQGKLPRAIPAFNASTAATLPIQPSLLHQPGAAVATADLSHHAISSIFAHARTAPEQSCTAPHRHGRTRGNAAAAPDLRRSVQDNTGLYWVKKCTSPANLLPTVGMNCAI